jgi:hypothetical protein
VIRSAPKITSRNCDLLSGPHVRYFIREPWSASMTSNVRRTSLKHHSLSHCVKVSFICFVSRLWLRRPLKQSRVCICKARPLSSQKGRRFPLAMLGDPIFPKPAQWLDWPSQRTASFQPKQVRAFPPEAISGSRRAGVIQGVGSRMTRVG